MAYKLKEDALTYSRFYFREKGKPRLDELWEKHPWLRTYKSVVSRCRNKGHHYFKKGVKCCITKEELKRLWIRDNAGLMENAIIHRIDSDKDYLFNNCMFIEKKNHFKIPRKRRDYEQPRNSITGRFISK